MAIRAVIFDMGGVLVRTEDKGPRTRLAERYGLTYAEIDEIVFGGESSRAATVGKRPAAKHWEYVCKRLDWPFEHYTELRDEFFAGDILDTDLVDYLRSLRPRYKTAILSNAHDDLRAQLTTKFPVMDAFDEIIISADTGFAKPQPEIYRLAVQRLGVQPEEAVFVDDVLSNVEAARSEGLHAIQFRSRDQVLAELEKLLNGR